MLICCQFILAIVLIIIFGMVRNRYSKTNVVYVQLIEWILIVVAGLLLLNSIITTMEKINFSIIESTLAYDDTYLMFVSLISTIAIAFFQYRIQNLLQNEEKTKELREKAQHKIELRSEQLHNINQISQLSGICLNNYVSHLTARLKYNIMPDSWFYIRLKGNESNRNIFYLECFEVKEHNVYIIANDNEIKIPDDNVYFYRNKLCFEVNESFLKYNGAKNQYIIESVRKFLSAPVTRTNEN